MRWNGLAWALLSLAAGLACADTPDARMARAVEQLGSGDFPGACVTLRPLVQNSPGDPDAWNLLGICESELHRPSAAREAFEHGLKLAPGSVALHENIGLFYYGQGDYVAARRHLAEAVELGSDKPGVAFSLAASQIRSGEKAGGLAALFRLESRLANEADYWTERGWAEMPEHAADASVSFDRALAIAPADARALNGAASAAEASEQDEKALSYLVRAKKIAPGDLRTLLHFGSVCLRRDLTVDALDALEHAHKLAPRNNLALFLYARAQIGVQQWQESYDLFAEFDRRVPGYAPAQYALGWLDLKLNRTVEARKHLERSLALEPSLDDARYELGALDLTEGHVEAAEKQLRAVLDRQPRHANANIALGDVVLRKGQTAEAKALYETAIDADPKSGPAHYKLSKVLLRAGDPERADQERALGASLNAEAVKASKTVLVLAEPDGRLLTGDPGLRK